MSIGEIVDKARKTYSDYKTNQEIKKKENREKRLIELTEEEKELTQELKVQRLEKKVRNMKAEVIPSDSFGKLIKCANEAGERAVSPSRRDYNPFGNSLFTSPKRKR